MNETVTGLLINIAEENSSEICVIKLPNKSIKTPNSDDLSLLKSLWYPLGHTKEDDTSQTHLDETASCHPYNYLNIWPESPPPPLKPIAIKEFDQKKDRNDEDKRTQSSHTQIGIDMGINPKTVPNVNKSILDSLTKYLQKPVYISDYSKIESFSSLYQAPYRKFYILSYEGLRGDDYCVRIYSNGIIVLNAAKSNLVFSLLDSPLESFEFSYPKSIMENCSQAKKTRHGLILSQNMKVASIVKKATLSKSKKEKQGKNQSNCSNEAIFNLRACIKGRLIDYNSRLLDNINLLVEKAEDEGWLFIARNVSSTIPENWISEHNYKSIRKLEIKNHDQLIYNRRDELKYKRHNTQKSKAQQQLQIVNPLL